MVGFYKALNLGCHSCVFVTSYSHVFFKKFNMFSKSCLHLFTISYTVRAAVQYGACACFIYNTTHEQDNKLPVVATEVEQISTQGNLLPQKIEANSLPPGNMLHSVCWALYVIAVPSTGICVGDPIRLVMEIAKLGPLNKFLRKKL